MSRTARFALTLCAAVPLLSGCERPTSPAGLVSSPDMYDAVAIVYESPDGELIDLVSRGATFEIGLDETEGAFESSFDYLDTHIDIDGDFDVTDSEIVFSDDPFLDDATVTERTLDFDEAGDRLYLRDLEGEFDFDGDGFRETAEFRVILERR